MAKRLEGIEYEDIKNRKGEVTETLTAILYAPDGSVFKLCQGGSPLKYVAKGYKVKPDAIWQELHDALEEANAASLIRSDFDRTIKDRKSTLDIKLSVLKDKQDMESLEASIVAEEAKLEALLKGDPVEPNPVLDDPPKNKGGRPKKVK